MPSLWITSPAHSRYPVTRLALAQRRHLCDVLTSRGLEAHGVIVANDENLELAREFGFDTVEMDNSDLGLRLNAGFKYAADQGADFFVYVDSDEWVHPDFFEPLFDGTYAPEVGPHNLLELDPYALENFHSGPVILTGKCELFVDLNTGNGATVSGAETPAPWLIPRAVLRPFGFEPFCPDDFLYDAPQRVLHTRFGSLRPQLNWSQRSSSSCVHWKSREAITPYGWIETLPGATQVDAWPDLRELYPADLVALAEKTHLEMSGPECRGERNLGVQALQLRRLRFFDSAAADALREKLIRASG